MDYIKMRDIPKTLGIKKGDKIFVSSAIRDIVHMCKEHGDEYDLNVLIDAFIEAVGEDGTLIFPTYNWDWCKGETFDYHNTPSKVGALSQVALNRPDFKRTKHPIYSFAVWGKDKEYLCSLTNTSSFGEDSPFRFFRDNDVVNIIINCDFWTSFTFVHYVEEELLDKVKYRYLKNFKATYIDENGLSEERTYQMCVRSYALDVVEKVDDYEEEWIRTGAQHNEYINGIKYAVIHLPKTYPVIRKDILENNSRCLCSFKGQTGEPLTLEEEVTGLMSELASSFEGVNKPDFENKLFILKSYFPDMNIMKVADSGNKATTGTYGEISVNSSEEKEIVFISFIGDSEGNAAGMAGTAVMTYVAKTIRDFVDSNNSYRIIFADGKDRALQTDNIDEILNTLGINTEKILYKAILR